MGTLANSEDPDEMQHNAAAFHQGLLCLLRLKESSGTEYIMYLRPLNVHNGQSHTYCINMYRKIYQNTQG